MRNTDYDDSLRDAVARTHPRYIHLFNRALKRTTSQLGDIITANALTEHNGGTTYHCVADQPKVWGRNHFEAQKLAKGVTKVTDYQYFSNALLVDPNGKGENWTSTTIRAALGEVLILTFEYDRDAAFLDEQLGWMLPLKQRDKADVSPLGQLSTLLAEQYADYHGISAVWSGNKSIHLHISFRTNLYLRDHAEGLTPTAIHAGSAAHWRALLPIVEGVLKPTACTDPNKSSGPDTSLAVHSSFRRMPGAIRTVADEGHPMGLPIGTRVPQLVLWEQHVRARKRDVTKLFLSPSLFSTTAHSTLADTTSARFHLTDEEQAFCAEQMHSHYADCALEFVGFAVQNDKWIARFRNSSTDRHPSSIMDEDHDIPLVLGRDKVTDIPPLPLKLGSMLREWRRAYNSEQAFDVEDLKVARDKLSQFLPFWIGPHGHACFLLRAAEGLGKSTSLMRHIAVSLLTETRSRQPSMVALATYEDATQKADAFNEFIGPDSRFRGVVWTSFRRLYADCAEALGVKALDDQDADASGMSLRDMIRERQPEVMAEMRAELSRLWSELDGKTPILFTAHHVAHMWRDNTYTRQMLDPAFFDEGFDGNAARAGSRLNWLVHDEVAVDTFVDVYSPRQFAWLSGLAKSSGAIWSNSAAARQRKAYDGFLKAGGEEHAVGFFEAARALRSGLDAFDTIEIKDAQEYFDLEDDVRWYQCAGHVYRMRERNWWHDGNGQVAERIAFLTTEVVPTLVASKVMGDELAIKEPLLRLGRDRADISAKRFKADKVKSMAKPMIAEGYIAIANRLGELDCAMSPHSARGRNDLADQNIVQFVNHFHPAKYGKMQALNTWMGRNDLSRIAHIDEINQVIGRNRGPRNQGAAHEIVINRNLYSSIIECDTAVDQLRYQLDYTMPRSVQYDVRKAAKQDGNNPDGEGTIRKAHGMRDAA